MNWRFRLEEAVHDARERTGVPGVAAGFSQDGESAFAAAGVRVLGEPEPVRAETPFRIASISKPFTATLAARSLELDEELCALLSHTAGLRCESAELLPESCLGLWSYSNAGYWAAGARAAAACGSSFSDAMRSRVLEPLGLGATGYDEPAGGHAGTCRKARPDSVPCSRMPTRSRGVRPAASGRRSPISCASASTTSTRRRALHEPRAQALGAAYALGWWVRDLGGRTALDHEGSVGGYQSLLLLVPEERLVLALLTNSWRGSGAIRRIVERSILHLPPLAPEPIAESVAGVYALDGVEATIAVASDGLRVTEAETDPVTGSRIERRYPARSIGGGVFGFADGVLQSHRLDVPRADVARVGWLALPRVSP